MSVLARIGTLEANVTALNATAANMTTGVSKLLAQENVTSFGVVGSMQMLGNLKLAAAANEVFADQLSNRSLQVEAAQRADANRIRRTRKEATTIDSNQKMLSSQGSQIGMEVLALERAVNATLPGYENISSRINQTEAVIKLFNETLKKGVSKNISGLLTHMLGDVRTLLRNMTVDLKMRRMRDEK